MTQYIFAVCFCEDSPLTTKKYRHYRKLMPIVPIVSIT